MADFGGGMALLSLFDFSPLTLPTSNALFSPVQRPFFPPTGRPCVPIKDPVINRDSASFAGCFESDFFSGLIAG